jgi:hypothetical protein
VCIAARLGGVRRVIRGFRVSGAGLMRKRMFREIVPLRMFGIARRVIVRRMVL